MHEAYHMQRNLSGGYPSPDQGAPQCWPGEVAQSWMVGTPILTRGTPGLGYHPQPGLGYPPERIWDQIPGKEHGTGVLPQVWMTNKLKILPSPILRMRALKS